MKAQKVGKGLGEDLIGSGVAHFLPLDLVRIVYPLVLKSALLISAPIQWKGGKIQEVFENKGPPAKVLSYRDVTLSDICGKAFLASSALLENTF